MRSRIGGGSSQNRGWLRRSSALSGARPVGELSLTIELGGIFDRTSTHKTQAQLTVIYSYGAAAGKQGIAGRICPARLPNPKFVRATGRRGAYEPQNRGLCGI